MARYQKKIEDDIRCPLEYGIAGKMIEYIKEKYKDFLYIEGMPEDKNNVPFYEKHGFSVMKNGAAIQICNLDK